MGNKDNKVTDEQIVWSLRCHENWNDMCEQCPYTLSKACGALLARNALDLFYRLGEEIARLKAFIKSENVIVLPHRVEIGQEVYALLDKDFSDVPEERIAECTVTEVGSRGFWVSGFVPPQDDMGDFFLWEKVGEEVFFSREDAANFLMNITK